MAQIPYRANLSSAIYPMTVADAGRTVINPGADQNFDRRVDPMGEQKDAGIPQAMYLENVLPTTNGYQSVGLRSLSSRYKGSSAIQYVCRVNIPGMYSPNSRIPVPAVLLFYADDTVIATWGTRDLPFDPVTYAVTVPGTFTSPITQGTVSFGVARGVLYMFVRFTGKLYTITGTSISALTITDVTASLAGVTASTIAYISGAYNYLILACTNSGKLNLIRWSSTITSTEFTVSLVTGAGQIELGDVNTDISFLKAHPVGLFVYCFDKVIVGEYTGNSRYPFKFSPIQGSDGYADEFTVSANPEDASHVGLSLSGQLQIISPRGAESVIPEVTTYLERVNYYDTFNSSANTFGVAPFEREVYVTSISNYWEQQKLWRIWQFFDRYIMLSQGSTSFVYDYCIVYDRTLQRFGRIKLRHTFIFNSENNIYFLDQATGATYEMVFDIYQTGVNYTGVLVVGKFQFVRNKMLKLEEVEIESTQDSTRVVPNFELVLLPSLDGRNFITPVPLVKTADSSGNLAAYKVHRTAKNHTLVLKGAFNVNTLAMRFVPAGDR